MEQKVAIIGFGGVGQGFLTIVEQKKQQLEERYNRKITIVSIADLYKGSVHHDDGLSLQDVKASLDVDGTLHYYPKHEGTITGLSAVETIQQTNADVIVELTFTDVVTGEPAITHTKAALQAKKHVVMTNKGPIVKAYNELKQLADENGVSLLFEGTVMSGTPALRMPLETLKGNDITEIRGIFNGTTNYMLTEMATGKSYTESLQEAKSKGFAEADPTNDVEGYDVQGKVVILANVLLGANLTREDVPTTGITNIQKEDIQRANEQQKVWKLLGTIANEQGIVKGEVKPVLLDKRNPLAQIEGATNAVTYSCDLSGDITLIGAGAGIPETGFAVLVDILSLPKTTR
ncbi:homoserine dehydrogenase [Bacillaceae bacterium JMAK1]|nr:homoserine dehydrogenase [Bacillaceae bacterium JMAK1]